MKSEFKFCLKVYRLLWFQGYGSKVKWNGTCRWTKHEGLRSPEAPSLWCPMPRAPSTSVPAPTLPSPCFVVSEQFKRDWMKRTADCVTFTAPAELLRNVLTISVRPKRDRSSCFFRPVEQTSDFTLFPNF